MRRISAPIATFMGAGAVPVAPGTAGSLAAVLFAGLLRHPHNWTPVYFLALSGLSLLPGIWAAHAYAQADGTKDPPGVVIDEALGQWITLAGATLYNWKSVLAAFLLFRLFDIWKPFPVRQAERLPDGVGIVADDVLAGVYGGLVLWAVGCFNLY